MKRSIFSRKHLGAAVAVVLTLVLGLAAGCRRQAARTDRQMAGDIQAKIHSEQALGGQDIRVDVANGVATLSGNVTDEASRTLAAYDSGSVNGVRTVVNNLTVQQAALTTPAPVAPASTAAVPPAEQQPRASRHDRTRAEPAVVVPPAPVTHVAAQPASPSPAAPAPPPEPPKPVVKTITLPAGTIVPVRITEALDSKTAQTNDVFHGALASDLGIQGVIAIPHGAPVLGRIVEAREAAHFKGNSLLNIELTQVTARGQRITLVTDSYSKQGEGRGKNTIEKAGGGAVFGSIIGALAGGGKGAAIGGLAGSATGAGVNAATRGQQVTIPAETLINFRLQSPLTLKVTVYPQGNEPAEETGEPQLQRR